MYTKQDWVDYTTPVDAEHMNHIEDGIESATNVAEPILIQAESHTTIETYAIPILTVEQVQAAYNGVVAGKNVFVIDDMEYITMQVIDASSIDGVSIRILFTNKFILTYKINEDTVELETKSLYDIASGFDGNAKLLSEVDLDTIFNTGIYFCNVCTHRPGNSNGNLIVSKINNATNFAFQMYFAYAEDDVYVRFRDNNTWGTWKKYISNSSNDTNLFEFTYTNNETSLEKTIKGA